MRNYMKNISFVVMIFLFLSFIVYFIYALKYYSPYSHPVKLSCIYKNYNLYEKLSKISPKKIFYEFNYSDFLENGDYCDFKSLQSTINIFDSTYNDYFTITEPILYYALADSLIKKERNSINTNNLDYLISRLNWISGFRYYSEMSVRNRDLYESIHGAWLSKISNEIIKSIDKDKNLLFNYKVKHILSLCKAEGYIIPIKISNSYKVIDNLINGNYSYILKRFWYSTSLFLKLLVFVPIVITSFIYINFFKNLKK